nr:BapA/Bap/LapF family large adhesin [Acinetobacter sp. Marseille-Q1620]
MSEKGVTDDEQPTFSGSDAVAGAIIAIYDGDTLLGTTTADNNGYWTFTPDTLLDEGDHSISVTQSVNGVESIKSPTLDFSVDVTPPYIITAEVNETNTEIEIQTEENSYVEITDSEGNVLGTGMSDENGNLTIVFDSAVEKGKLLNVTATDEAGNTATTEVRAGLPEVIAAVDNDVELLLDVVPTVTSHPNPSELNKTGFTVASVGLGPVLSANVLEDVFKSSPQISVEEGTTHYVRFWADAGGLTFGTMDLYVYKQNATTGEWEQQDFVENWFFAAVGGSSSRAEYTLDEGEWMFVLSPGEGITTLTGYTIHFIEDTVSDYNNLVSVEGSITGNMLTDVDATHGADELPTGTTLTTINGQEVLADGETIILGEYGILTVQSDGSYTYEIYKDFNGYGQTDTFHYVVTSPSGMTAEADLNIELNIEPATDQLVVDQTVLVDVQPTITETTNSDIKSVIGFELANVDVLGGVINGSVLEAEGVMKWTVGENSVRELTFDAEALGGSINTSYDLYIYKLDEATGNYVQVHMEDNWFYMLVGGAFADAITLKFGEGEYRAMLTSDGGMGVATGNRLHIVKDKLYDYANPLSLHGSVSDDATEDSGTVLLEVNNQAVEPGKMTEVEGKFGTLTIGYDGTYTYEVTKPENIEGWEPPYGEIDTFYLVTQTADGKTVIETLNIKIGTHGAQDDDNQVQIIESNVVSGDLAKVDINDVKANATIEHGKDNLIGTSTDTWTNSYADSTSFVVNENTVANGTVNITATLNGGILGIISDDQWGDFSSKYTITQIVNGETVVIASGALTLNGDKATAIFDVSDLVAGEYTINVEATNITTSQGLAWTDGSNNGEFYVSVNADVKETSLNDYKVDANPKIVGDLFENDLGAKSLIDTLSIGRLEVYVNDPGKGADAFTVAGEHGTLTVKQDGSYEYVPNGTTYGIDSFVYKTISVTGVEESATLEINVGKVVTASKYSDVVESSAGNDQFAMGDGADTVIYNLLSDDNTGGNGHDTWTDFKFGQGDKIDISELLIDGTSLAEAITVDQDDIGNVVLKIDRDGSTGDAYQSEALITLTNVDKTDNLLDDLINGGHLI